MSRGNGQVPCLYCDEAVARTEFANHVSHNHPDVDVKDEVKVLDAVAAVDPKPTFDQIETQRNPIAEEGAISEIIGNVEGGEKAVSDGVVALSACLKQQLPLYDGYSALYAENAVSTNNVDSLGKLLALLASDNGVSTSKLSQLLADLAGADQESLKHINFAVLASAGLKLKNIVDLLMQKGSKAENDIKWFKRALDECSSSSALVELALPIVPPTSDDLSLGAVASEIRATDDDLAYAVPAAVDLVDRQFLSYYVASGEWLQRAVFALTTSVVASTVTDRQVIVESGLVSADVARQWWLEQAGACMVASIACLIKWMQTLDAGVVESNVVGLASELGGEEERQPQDMALEILNALTELRVKEDLLAFIEAAEEESAKRNDKDDDI